jgi:fibronectin-binding autotransporter adhesin
MKTTRGFSTWTSVVIVLVLAVSIAVGGNIKNAGTINNSSNTTVTGFFENFKLAAGGIFNNTGGTYSVGSYFSNNNTGGTDGQASISGGTLAVTGVYTNDNGTTTNTATIQVAADITNVAGTFTTSSGTVEYNGAGAAQSVMATTYGGLKVTATGTKTLAGSATVNTTFVVSAGTLAVGTNSLDIKTATITSGGTLSAASGTVSYTGTGAQQVFPASYGVLTLSGSGSVTKTVTGGNISVATTLNNPSTITLDVGANNFSTGASANVADAVNPGTVKVAGTVTFGQASPDIGGTFDYSGAGQAIALAQYKTLSISGTGSPSFGASEYKVSGSFTIPGTATPTFAAGNTIHYNGPGAQTVAALSYKLLKFSEAGTKSISGAVTAAAAAAGSVAVDIVSTNSPTLTIATGASLGITLGQLQNASIVNINGTGSMTLTNGNLLNLSGANLNVNAAGSTLTLTGDLENDGTITNAGTISVQ